MEDNECIFCFEGLNKYDTAILNCPHKYHLHCIKQWNIKSKQYNIVCPQCNTSGEIINVVTGSVKSPEITSNEPERTTEVRLYVDPTMQSYTYYPLPINPNEQSDNNQLILLGNSVSPTQYVYQNEAFEQQNRNRNQNRPRYEEEIEPFICCTIL
jgi:hypothetical protein